MKKLTKDHIAAIDICIESCITARETVQTLIEEYNQFIESWGKRAEEAISGYNDQTEELRDAYNQAAEEAQQYYDERSETWQSSDAGNKYADWISQLENPDIEELDIDLPELIEDVAFDDWENAEEFLPPEEPEK
jgi:ElaB/YqjD/DUF883 family membrane-anchored ribosome-binding protein